MLRHQKNGRRMSDEPPYGWRRDPDEDKQMVEDAHEQGVIQQICQLRESGEGLRGIARHLNESGIRPRRAESWNHQTVKAILQRYAAQFLLCDGKKG